MQTKHRGLHLYIQHYNCNLGHGDRASSHISPTIFTKNNQVVLALGAAGGNKIPVAINQVAYRYLKQNLPLSEALFMPRVYKDDSPIYIERHMGLAGFNDSVTQMDFHK